MSELWKAVPGFEGAYEVSDDGRVRSLHRGVRIGGVPQQRQPCRQPSLELEVGDARGEHGRPSHARHRP
jgi:hypothetical protein